MMEEAKSNPEAGRNTPQEELNLANCFVKLPDAYVQRLEALGDDFVARMFEQLDEDSPPQALKRA